ncbi:hypothetical protein D3C87_1545210 [compost metagenome]
MRLRLRKVDAHVDEAALVCERLAAQFLDFGLPLGGDRTNECGFARLFPDHVVLANVPAVGRDAPGKTIHPGGDEADRRRGGDPVHVEVIGIELANQPGSGEALREDHQVLHELGQGAGVPEQGKQRFGRASRASDELAQRQEEGLCPQQRQIEMAFGGKAGRQLGCRADRDDRDGVAPAAEFADLGHDEGLAEAVGGLRRDVDQVHARTLRMKARAYATTPRARWKEAFSGPISG